MSLTRKQMQEIVAFDLKRRTGLDFDGRRFGSRRLDCGTDAWPPLMALIARKLVVFSTNQTSVHTRLW